MDTTTIAIAVAVGVVICLFVAVALVLVVCAVTFCVCFACSFTIARTLKRRSIRRKQKREFIVSNETMEQTEVVTVADAKLSFSTNPDDYSPEIPPTYDQMILVVGITATNGCSEEDQNAIYSMFTKYAPQAEINRFTDTLSSQELLQDEINRLFGIIEQQKQDEDVGTAAVGSISPSPAPGSGSGPVIHPAVPMHLLPPESVNAEVQTELSPLSLDAARDVAVLAREVAAEGRVGIAWELIDSIEEIMAGTPELHMARARCLIQVGLPDALDANAEILAAEELIGETELDHTGDLREDLAALFNPRHRVADVQPVDPVEFDDEGPASVPYYLSRGTPRDTPDSILLPSRTPEPGHTPFYESTKLFEASNDGDDENADNEQPRGPPAKTRRPSRRSSTPAPTEITLSSPPRVEPAVFSPYTVGAPSTAGPRPPRPATNTGTAGMRTNTGGSLGGPPRPRPRSTMAPGRDISLATTVRSIMQGPM
ncbi:hypothetical protein J8273_7963 [Carpediemonas membranifera]|uniref:Uncharacterized protein n=1 Tax=Carpediemonas membranifera TaxID=201153 RepID=A0A8J6B5T0_9EUKA|nr:hypothetical protein J8273_7963 [Carpediemonas membranifera]|eukprot:KAG9390612.1 hypothetical protein J8273_7963 [Carpediemonas membranifera]